MPVSPNFNLRIPTPVRQLWEEAADTEERSLSDWIRRTCTREAERLIARESGELNNLYQAKYRKARVKARVFPSPTSASRGLRR